LLSQTRYYAFRLQLRPSEFPTILLDRMLLQQFIVDSWASADQTHLRFLCENQPLLRASLYSGLQDATHNALDRDVNLNNLGQHIILPSTYIGGPQNIQQLYQDGMAIGHYFKQIDIFLTMTANPSWWEISQELFPHQTAADRPDLVAQVF
jgi:hypothetical protein